MKMKEISYDGMFMEDWKFSKITVWTVNEYFITFKIIK